MKKIGKNAKERRDKNKTTDKSKEKDKKKGKEKEKGKEKGKDNKEKNRKEINSTQKMSMIGKTMDPIPEKQTEWRKNSQTSGDHLTMKMET